MSAIKATYGYTSRQPGYGYTGVKGLNAVIATVSTPTSAPLIAASQLRRGGANSARGAARLVADAAATAAKCGASGLLIVRADSAYYTRDVVAAAGRAGARFSITARMNPAVITAGPERSAPSTMSPPTYRTARPRLWPTPCPAGNPR